MNLGWFQNFFLKMTSLLGGAQEFFATIGYRTPAENIKIIIINGYGWISLLILMAWLLFPVYMDIIQGRYANKIKWTVLAIDVPKDNEQSVRAVENIFAAMWPFYESINLVEKYIGGKFQQAFSLEIASVGGYTQFMVRVPLAAKNLVEAAVYAQYPKAEIAEIEDYTERFKSMRFPSDEWDMFGSEFKLMKPSPYPLRMHPEFEHTLTQTFADPMAALLEVFNKMNRDEELWMQLVITPIKDSWKKEGYEIINKIIGAKTKKKKGLVEVLLAPLYAIFTTAQEMINYGLGFEAPELGGAAKQESEGPMNNMLYLTPEEKAIVEGISYKMTKIAYQTKFRFIYLAPKGKMDKPKGVAGLIGAMQQFSTIHLNQFVPFMKSMTKANYFFVKRRVTRKQNKLMSFYRSRSQGQGGGLGFVLNIEELASIFHFPVPEAMSGSVRKVEAKKESAPHELPDTIFQAAEEERHKVWLTEQEIKKSLAKTESDDDQSDRPPKPREQTTAGAPPTDLPV